MARLHERTGRIVGRNKYGQAIVEHDDYDPAATRCCDHPHCEATPVRQSVVTFGLREGAPRVEEGVRVRTYWLRDVTRGGLAGEVIE
jgi:hypothetical protein